MSKAGKPSSQRRDKAPKKLEPWKDKAIQMLELFGYGLVLLFVIGLVLNRFNSWAPLIVYGILQLIVMVIDRFRTWWAWPFIVRDWRKYGIGNHT
jgi:hypothetical protein